MTTIPVGPHAGRPRSFRYENFSLTFEVSEGGIRVRLLRSPYGGAVSKFSPPFASTELQEILARLEAALGRSAPRQSRDLACVEKASDGITAKAMAQSLGAALFEALFTGAVRERYLLSLGSIDSDPDQGLRIQLVLDPDNPELAFLSGLPWELLYRRETRHFLARDLRTPVCRFLEVPQPSSALLVTDRLRILVAMASPTDSQPLDLAAERRRIEEAWAHRSGVIVEFIEHAGIEEVYQRLRDESCQVLHFMGHGNFEGQKGALLFEDDNGRSVPVLGEVLGESLRSIPSLRLVFLNACRSATFSRQAGFDPYSGVANALVIRGVPSVLAMQFPISDDAAVHFSGAFYSALAAGDPVDRAAADGRLAVFRAAPDSLEWATPALFLNVVDGRLFTPSELTTEPILHTVEETLHPESIVWADQQPLVVEDFTVLAQGRKSRQSISFLFGRKGAWTGILVDRAYVLINDTKPKDVKYCYLTHGGISLAEAPASVEIELETIAQDQDLAGAGVVYRLDPRKGLYYAFVVKPLQRFAIYRQDAVGFRLLYGGQSSAIRAGELNRVAVYGLEDQISFYVNEQLVKTIEDDQPWGDLTGIVAISRGRFRFENFTLFRPLR